ncbi:type VI secretion system tip protein VgrG [Geomonas sp. Red32]|uniref:type VI secretion system Vgr family protein n=1 Tax=Geomonas sp. Red32 TaxID=2912856 RepID=UPI00202CCD10|nr:type VI secretion system tip protein TssI/VgrG [Geomonas sp. Red32]MCM0084105.1 type VI secretion system tip protein VgrG [Geomonas sp. Red32]
MEFADAADKPMFFFKIHGTPFDFHVTSFEAIEAISSPFQINVTVVCETAIPFEKVAGMGAVLTVRTKDLTADGGNRYFHGMISKLKLVELAPDGCVYRVRLLPAIWRLSLEQDCRIFQNTTVQSIIKTILEESCITSDMFSFALIDSELNCSYCVQYNETDLNFISRLMEEEGLLYFFEHHEDKHVLTICDDSFFCPDIHGDCALQLQGSHGMAQDAETVSAFNLSCRLATDCVTTRSFSYEHPSYRPGAEKCSRREPRAEMYEYTGSFVSDKREERLAKARLGEHAALEKRAKGESNCPRLSAGHRFDLESFSGELVGRYVVAAMEHVGDQPQALDGSTGGCAQYWNGFIAIPEDAHFKPSRITPKPVIAGMQTAMVTGPAGEEIYHDELGRVKVQFHWDRQGKKNERSSCWLRYAQGWGGAGWGMQFIPRVGDEVLVAFIDGNPDRPVIVGSLYNAENLPLYDPQNKYSVSTIKTRSYPNGDLDNFHELRFDDRKGSEELYLQSERDWNILVKNDKVETVGNDTSVVVGKSLKIEAGASVEIVCGASSITMDSSGFVTINGTRINITGSDLIGLTSVRINLN